jgi:N-acetylmuramoyl-L-alanine amidase
MKRAFGKNGFLFFVWIFPLFFSAPQNAIAQRLLKLNVVTPSGEKRVSYLTKHGLVYASARELAKVLGFGYYYNTNADKLEVKSDTYRLLFTARNQYVILRRKNGSERKVFQLPVSTLLLKKDVFVPLDYSLRFFKLLYGKEILFAAGEREIRLTSRPYSENKSDISEKGKKALPPKTTYDIYGMEISEKSNGTLIRLKTGREIRRFSSSINENTLFVFLPDVSIAPDLLKNFKPSGFVRKVKLKKVGGNVQLEFLLKKGYEAQESFQDPDNHDILIAIHSKVFARRDNVGKLVKKWKFSTVVIDPGHGGKDAGAIGVTGVKEKDINLKIALELGRLIRKNLKNVKVVFTRKTDKFVELYKRGKIANEHHGNLFISIHCNSLIKKPSSTNGFEIYLLRPGRAKEAIRIAEYENSVIKYEDDPKRYKKLTDENFILVSMAHSAFMRYSEKFSEILNKEYAAHTKIKSRGVKQAGLYVLVGASMPGVLVETGFISNYKDEAYLKSKNGQRAIAKAIYLAIKKYIKYYSKTVREES